MFQEMCQRLDFSCEFGMGGEIAGGVELRMRRAALPPTLGEIVQQRLDARGGHVGILGYIPGRIKEWMGLTTLAPAVGDIVLERLEFCRPHVGIAFQIPGGIEELPRRVFLPPAAAAVISPRPPTDMPLALAVGGQVPDLVEIRTQVGLHGGRHGLARDRIIPVAGVFRGGGGSTKRRTDASR